MLAKEASPRENEKHTHRVVRLNLQACSECGHFFVTSYVRTENGDLVVKELELDLKVKSSRIVPYPPAGDVVGVTAQQPADRRKAIEETCW